MPDKDQDRLLALVGCIRGIALEFDADARYVNAWADDPALLARPASEMIGASIDEVLGPAGAQFTAMVRRVFETGVIEHFEYPIELPAGPRWFFADIKRVDSESGQPTVVMFARDITDRKAAELALARSEERYRLAGQATNDVLWDWDLATHIVTWNAATATVLGFAARETPVTWWKEKVHPDDRLILERLQAALDGDASSWSARYRFRRGDGSYADFVDRGFIMRDANGRAYRMVGSMTDVTKINRLQAQLLHADRMCALGTLAAGVGHEINNPLTYVLGNLDASIELLEGRDDELHELLAEAAGGARRIASIVKSLKMFTRSDEAERRAVDVHSILDAAIEMAEMEIRQRARVRRIYGATPRVFANDSQLAQVFLNLLMNAVHMIPEGNPGAHEIRVAADLDDDGGASISIQDTGVGLPVEDLARVFDPFFGRQQQDHGSGLGLAICHDFIEKHDGTITVTSELGRGTTFTIKLPAAAAPTPSLPRVLVIDDEVQIGRLVTRMLRSKADVVALTRAKDGLERISAEHFDVVLCDLMMPETTGIDVYDELRRTNPDLLRRVFFITGGAFTPKAQEFLDSLGSMVIEKPLDRQRLLDLLPPPIPRRD
jgi:PAS domain S-box-containing protein